MGVERIPFGMEFAYGEKRGDVVQFARAMIEAGADLVIGHGPHLPRAMELYRDRLIAYSLGNFATYYGISVAGPKGLRTNSARHFGRHRKVSKRQDRLRDPDSSWRSTHRRGTESLRDDSPTDRTRFRRWRSVVHQ